MKNEHIEAFLDVLNRHASRDGEMSQEGYRQLHIHAQRVLGAFIPTDQGLQDLDRIAVRLGELTEKVPKELYPALHHAMQRVQLARTALDLLVQRLQEGASK